MSTSWEDVYRVQTARITELERENAALRTDRERLEWVIKDSYYHFFFKLSSDLEKGRKQIDAARQEAQPSRTDHSGGINEMMQARKEAQP